MYGRNCWLESSDVCLSVISKLRFPQSWSQYLFTKRKNNWSLLQSNRSLSRFFLVLSPIHTAICSNNLYDLHVVTSSFLSLNWQRLMWFLRSHHAISPVCHKLLPQIGSCELSFEKTVESDKFLLLRSCVPVVCLGKTCRWLQKEFGNSFEFYQTETYQILDDVFRMSFLISKRIKIWERLLKGPE